jgi:high-affinity iron transporter
VQRGAELWQSGIGRSWFPDLASLVRQTANSTRVTYGDDAPRLLVYLLQNPEAVVSSTESPLARSSRLLGDSLAAFVQGKVQSAYDLAVSAYLDGFELVEASLDTVDRRPRRTIEAEMMRYRILLKSRGLDCSGHGRAYSRAVVRGPSGDRDNALADRCRLPERLRDSPA